MDNRLYFLDYEEVLKADKPIFKDQDLTWINNVQENIREIVFAQNCYVMAMMNEDDIYTRAAIHAIFSGKLGNSTNLALQWLKLVERKYISENPTYLYSRLRIEFVKMEIKRELNKWYPFNKYFDMCDKAELPKFFVVECVERFV